jgi:hypothetical protein
MSSTSDHAERLVLRMTVEMQRLLETKEYDRIEAIGVAFDAALENGISDGNLIARNHRLLQSVFTLLRSRSSGAEQEVPLFAEAVSGTIRIVPGRYPMLALRSIQLWGSEEIRVLRAHLMGYEIFDAPPRGVPITRFRTPICFPIGDAGPITNLEPLIIELDRDEPAGAIARGVPASNPAPPPRPGARPPWQR